MELDLMPKRELALRIWEAVAGLLGDRAIK